VQSPSSLSLEELALFNEFFTQKFGLYFPEHKREILESRLLPRLRAQHLQRFIDYYLMLQYDFDRELDALTQAITNNESYFFRETSQFDALQGSVLHELIETSSRGRLKILSAGCSSGEEPYTLNIVLRRSLGQGDKAPLQIEAIDLDVEKLEQAREAIYRPGSLRALTPEQIERLFVKLGDEAYELRPPHRLGVQFRRGNILDPTTLGPAGTYDVLFCRNVLIYFAETSLKAAIDHFAKAVRPGGLLFLGHSESIIGLTQLFQAERLGNCIAYRRKQA
jgi:chemotaxis protein methyltransferase CheR